MRYIHFTIPFLSAGTCAYVGGGGGGGYTEGSGDQTKDCLDSWRSTSSIRWGSNDVV